MRVAVFDFCDTIVNFQTADRFVYYVIEHTDSVKIKKRKAVLKNIQKLNFAKKIDKITNGKYSLNKRIVLWQLRGVSKQEMDKWSESYYKEEIVPNLYVDMLNFILEYQRKGYRVYLASGGYDIYLKYFISEYNLNGGFCTKLKFNRNIFSGKFDGMDCIRGNKIKMLNEYFKEDLEYKIVYTDSKSDIPLLLWANEGIVVSKKSCRSWPKAYGLSEYLLTGGIIEKNRV